MHRALNSLIEKGLISYVTEGKRKLYQATNPEHFIQFIEEKKQRFQKILPELKHKQKQAKQLTAATIYKGKHGINEVYNILISNKEAKEYNTFGGGDECAKFMGMTWWISMHTKRVANKLPSRQVFDESVRAVAPPITSKPLTKARYLPAQFASFQETAISGEYVAITCFTENAYSFLIQDRKIAEGYKKYFELLWKVAKR